MKSVVVALLTLAACRDVSRFSSHGDRFEGAVVKGSFVRTGVGELSTMCLTLDTDHLQDAPGAVSTSDGRFHKVALRPIPQLWHDQLSSLSFGEGRVQNLVYAAEPDPLVDGSREDILAVVSLMQSDHIEVRLLRGAPGTVGSDAGAATAPPVFAVFNLDRQDGPCAY